jgi:hypothetical protein
MTIRLEIDLTDETAKRFGFLLRHLNALAVCNRADIWTPSELAASIIREVVEDDLDSAPSRRKNH